MRLSFLLLQKFLPHEMENIFVAFCLVILAKETFFLKRG